MENPTPEQAAQLEIAKKIILNKILTKNAIERLGRVRLANPILATQVETYLIQLFQTGQLKDTVTDIKLKQILSVLAQNKKITIKRR